VSIGRTADICPSLNPTFNSGNNQGRDIYVLFYGPFPTLRSAQDMCLNLGRTSRDQCFLAPLTMNPADRSMRYGPLD
jgi:hypothetical protein